MSILHTQINPRTEVFQANEAAMRAEVDKLEQDQLDAELSVAIAAGQL